MPLRYLPKHNRYRLYDQIEVPVTRSTKDARPESYKVRSEQLRVVGHLGTERGWEARRRVIFADRSWHYDCLEDLKVAEQQAKTSLGLIEVGEIDWVKLEERGEEERKKHDEKLNRLRAKLDLFGPEQRNLEFYPYRVRVGWHCARLSGPNPCPGHTAAVLDWGLGELGRREGPEAAVARMEELCTIEKYDLRFYAGNFKAHPKSFGIVGLWYPLRREVEAHAFVQESLTL